LNCKDRPLRVDQGEVLQREEVEDLHYTKGVWDHHRGGKRKNGSGQKFVFLENEKIPRKPRVGREGGCVGRWRRARKSGWEVKACQTILEKGKDVVNAFVGSHLEALHQKKQDDGMFTERAVIEGKGGGGKGDEF